MKMKSLSHVRLLETSWTAAYHAPPSVGFSRQEYWSGVPLPSPVMLSRDHQIAVPSVSWASPNFVGIDCNLGLLKAWGSGVGNS